MTVQCIRCESFSLREVGQMARQGFGRCKHEPRSSAFQSATFERQCHKFKAVDADTQEKRIVWLDWEKKRFLKEMGL